MVTSGGGLGDNWGDCFGHSDSLNITDGSSWDGMAVFGWGTGGISSHSWGSSHGSWLSQQGLTRTDGQSLLLDDTSKGGGYGKKTGVCKKMIYKKTN